MYIYIYMGGGSPTGKSYSFRSCVRAKLRVPVRRCCFQRWATGARKVLLGVQVARALPPVGAKLLPCFWRWPANRGKSLLIDCKLFLVASRCLSLLPAAFPPLPAAFRLNQSKFMRLDHWRSSSCRVSYYRGNTYKCDFTKAHSQALP